jgi:hypothetical protein
VTGPRNANEFLAEFRRLQKRYERDYGPLQQKIRAKYASEPPTIRRYVDQSLEFHIREYVTNALLSALHWRMNVDVIEGLPNLVPEVPVGKGEEGKTRFLDYLGVDISTDCDPLMIVEAKRHSSDLPRLALAKKPASTYSEIVARGLAGETLGGEWPKWLKALNDYISLVQSGTGVYPERVVITNGNWLIVFADPQDAFASGRRPNKEAIYVYRDAQEIEQRYLEVFSLLDHSNVLGERGPICPIELTYHRYSDAFEYGVHGLRLSYSEVMGVHEPTAPVIKVAPVIFLRSQFGSWLCVEADSQDYELPTKSSELDGHLDQMTHAAEGLLNEVETRLGNEVEIMGIADFYENAVQTDILSAVLEESVNRFMIITGESSHFIRREASIPDCPYHDWSQANIDHVACDPTPAIYRIVDPRRFFTSGEDHYCAHRDVVMAKAFPISLLQQDGWCPRSGSEGSPFCEIMQFEERLCCRTCVFEDVCTSAEVFHLPCDT